MAGEYLGAGRYREEQLGVADDHIDADGIDTLDFEQAKAKAAEKIASWHAHERASLHGPVPTVRSAVEAYFAAIERRRAGQGIKMTDARSRMRKHILSDAVSDVPLHELTEHHLVQWRERRPSELAPASVKRIVIDLRAALNATAKKHRAILPVDIAVTIKHGLSFSDASAPVARDGAALSDHDVRRLLDAVCEIDAEGDWDGDLLRLIAVMAATGGRFSQIVRMRVADFQIAQSRLMVPTSRKGHSTAGKNTHIAIRIGPDVVELLRPATAGRKANETLLERWWHGYRGNGEWVRDVRGPWTEAAGLHRPWLKIIRRAGLPEDTVPYALRHSSIVRMLRAGLPTRVVAQVHDTSTQMLEKHYSGAISDMMEDVIASAIVPLLPAQGGEKIVRLRAGQQTPDRQG
jgi:integrase